MNAVTKPAISVTTSIIGFAFITAFNTACAAETALMIPVTTCHAINPAAIPEMMFIISSPFAMMKSSIGDSVLFHKSPKNCEIP